MQPLKDGVRHGTGVGVEMTMSLSGPPGLHHHTTVPIHYMPRQQQSQQQKLLPNNHDPRKPPSTRAPGLDHGPGGHDPVPVGREHVIAGHGTRQPARELKALDSMRVVHDIQSVELLVAKEPTRIMPDHHHQLPSQQQPHHRGSTRLYPDARGVMMTHDKGSSLTAEPGAPRDAALLGESRGSSQSRSSSSSRPSQQSQIPLQDSRMATLGMSDSLGVYPYGIQSSYPSQIPASTIISPHQVQGKSGSGPSGLGPHSGISASAVYPGHKATPNRNGDTDVTTGLRSLHGQDPSQLYLSTKQSAVYQEDYSKTLTASHFMPEMGKGGSIHDVKQIGQHHIPQHRDLMRESASEVHDPRYSSSSNIRSKPGLEVTGHHLRLSEQSHSAETRRAVEDQMRKSGHFMGSHSVLYSKDHEPQANISKSMSYPSGAEILSRSVQIPTTSVSHLTHAPNLDSGHHQAYPASHLTSESGGAFPVTDQLTAAQLQKPVGVIRPPVHGGDERAWREGYAPASKSSRSEFLSDDIVVHPAKSSISHHDLESSHPSLHNMAPLRMQGSISTGQPRIMYDSSNNKTSYSDPVSQASSAEQYSGTQRDQLSSRPSSIGRAPQSQTSMPVIPHDERLLHGQTEKSFPGASTGGSAALDLTKLNPVGLKPVDSPLDLTVKTKRRHAEGRETPEYDRILSAAKRQKLDTSSPRSGLHCQKVVLDASDNAHNPIWISSPSPRAPESYDHRPAPSPAFSGHASSSSITRSHKYNYTTDGRISADSRVTSDGRLSVETRVSGDGRASVESRSSIDCRTPSSPQMHGKFPMGAPHSKIVSASMIPDIVKYPVGTNPPMVPLTTQLQKVKEEQAYQMKLQRMCSDTAHGVAKHISKEAVSSRHTELLSGSANEVIVVRHPQQHYDIPQQPRQQQNLQHSYIKQQQHHDVHQMQHPQQHQKLVSGQQEIIELGMKDSSDPLQASRGPSLGLQGFASQATLLQQQQQQQMYVVQHHQYSQKDQQLHMSAYSHHQQPQYSKEQMLQQQQQPFPKQQAQFISQQHYPGAQFSAKCGEDMERFYQKQQQQQHRKRNELDAFKQTVGSSQSSFVATHKWNITHQQRQAVKSAYPHTQPVTNVPVEYRSSKVSPGYPKPQSHTLASSGEGYRYSYARPDRAKTSEPHKLSLPHIAGPLPAGGVREESRRALSRRVSYSGPSTPGGHSADLNKQNDSIRKKSTSSLPEQMKVEDKSVPSHQMSGSSVPVINEKPSLAADDSTVVSEDTKSEDNQSLLSHNIPSHQTGSGQKLEETSLKDSLTMQPPGQFAVPLSVTIPQSTSPLNPSTQSPAAAAAAAAASSSRSSTPHKAWSRKHMILNAVNQDESLKKIISTSSKHEAGGISSECKNRLLASSTCSPIPASPKMPILSPQDDEGESASEEHGVRAQINNDDPPTLDPPSTGQTKPTVTKCNHPTVGVSSCPIIPNQTSSSAPVLEIHLVKEAYKNNNNNSQEVANNNNGFPGSSSTIGVTKDYPAVRVEENSENAYVVRRISIGTSLAESQLLQQDDQQKTQPGNVEYHRADIRRKSLTSHGLGPWGHSKNIPIANVAPFMHSRIDDDKSKQQKREEQNQSPLQNIFPSIESSQDLSGQTVDTPAPKSTKSDSEMPKEDSTIGTGEEADMKDNAESQEKGDSSLPASSSKKNISSRKKKLAKLTVSSPTKMKELELISPTLEYSVLKSTGIEEIKALDKLTQCSMKKSMEHRIKYQHKIVREKNNLVRHKKVVSKRIQYVFDDDEDEDDDEPTAVEDDDDDEDFEINGGSNVGRASSKSDAEAKARDREERALRVTCFLVYDLLPPSFYYSDLLPPSFC